MKTGLKRAFAVVLMAALVLSMTACGGFDAPAYVQGTLDGIFHGQANADYLKITGETADEVTQAHEMILEANADSFCDATGLDDSLITDSAYNKIIEMVRTLYGKTSYTVGKAEKTSDGYTVALTIEPVGYDMTALTDAITELQNEYVNGITSGQIAVTTEDDLNEVMAEMVERIVDLCVDQANTAENLAAVEETIKLTINDNVVSVADGEIERLESIMVSFI